MPFPLSHPSVYTLPHFKRCLSLSLPNSLLLFLLSQSCPASLSLSHSPSKQLLADGFPITTGTEGLGWLPHINAWAQHWTSAAHRRDVMKVAPYWAGRAGEAGRWSYVKVTQTKNLISYTRYISVAQILLLTHTPLPAHTAHLLRSYVNSLT